MKEQLYENEIKAIKLLQERSEKIDGLHSSISSDINGIKEQLASLAVLDTYEDELSEKKQMYLNEMSEVKELKEFELRSIYNLASELYPGRVSIDDILDRDDLDRAEVKLNSRVNDFNSRYSLDSWDYAIAGSCGLFASMLDLLCVKAPAKTSVQWENSIDGFFNDFVRRSFNKLLPKDISDALSKKYPIGSPDSSVVSDLLGAPSGTLNPRNHRLRALSHDPLLGFLFGVLDMRNGTCTTVLNGKITIFPSTKGITQGNVFQLLGRMFGHILSDINAPSASGKRGMGLPAPFMGILRMFEDVKVSDFDIGKQVEWLYVNGYDFRHFVVTSIPMAIMEVLLRVFYAIKQMKLYKTSFSEALLDTIPVKMNPRFRMILALAYGTSSSVNAGKMYITQNIMNLNYASWMGLAWNGFHALKWALVDKQFKLWNEIEAKEIEDIELLVKDMEALSEKAAHLPI